MKYVGDNSKTVLFHTSGTNLNTTGTGFWVGQVTSVSVDEDEGYFVERYAGTASRNVAALKFGPQTVGGNLQYNVQDFRMLKYALGSCVDSGSPTPYQHDFAETNNDDGTLEVGGESLPAFNLEVSKSVLIGASGVNFVRNVYGCFVNSFTLSASEGTILTANVDWVGRAGSFASGASTALTEDTNRDFLWSDSKWGGFSSGATAYANMKSWDFSVANNLTLPNYTDATRIIGTPIPTNRDYSVTWSLNADSDQAKVIYDQYFKGGSIFNTTLDCTASTGSRTLFVSFSGCKVTGMTIPEPAEGVHEFTVVITPRIVSAIEQSLTFKYNAE